MNVPDVAYYDIVNELSSIILTPAEIEIVLKSLPVGKAVGPDGISNKILRELSVELSLPFCSLFNQSLQTGVFPDCWKISNVCPIPKSGNRSSISNYRPVSLLCTSEKVFERTFLNTFSIIFNIIIFSLLFNLDSYQETQLLINLPICMILFHMLLTFERR